MLQNSEPRCEVCQGRQCRSLYSVKDFEHGISGEWGMLECHDCGFVFIWPKLSPAEVASFYPETYYSYGSAGSIDWLFQMVYRHDAKRISRLIGNCGKVLDVGCGSGDALRHMRRLGNYELWGIEIDGHAVRRGIQNGLSIVKGAITDNGFVEHDFNLIRMAYVIEHMLDPRAGLKRAFDILAPGGILVGSTNNTQCLDRSVFKKYWGGYQGPRHTCLFNPENLRRLLAEVGYTDISFTVGLRTVGWSGSIQNYLVDKCGLRVAPNGRVRWYLLLILPFLPVTVIQSLWGGTASMSFMARKPGASPVSSGPVGR